MSQTVVHAVTAAGVWQNTNREEALQISKNNRFSLFKNMWLIVKLTRQKFEKPSLNYADVCSELN